MIWVAPPVGYTEAMKTLLVAVGFATALLPAVAAEDQNDPVLDGLFDRLYQTVDTLEARQIEAEIQRVWDSSGSATADLLLGRGTFAMHSGDFAAAERALTMVVTQHPDFAEGWNRRATLYYLMGRLDDSVADVARTLALAPRHYGALSGLGQIQLIQEKYDEARESFRRALAANPHLVGARRFLRALDERLGEPI